MIIVKLIGGLGNQLFQYALGRHLAEINKTELKLDIFPFIEYKLHKYSLGFFNIKENIASVEEIENLKYAKENPLVSKIKKVLNRPKKLAPTYITEKEKFNFDPAVLSLPDNIYLDGSWQTEKYFVSIKNIIRREFTNKILLSEKTKNLAEEITKSESVSLHIRRGDLISNPKTNIIHGTCGLDYYNRCINLIDQKVKNPVFYIFSDDIEWAKDNLKLPYPAIFVDHNDAGKNYEDLYLQSQCKHQIIANSTFSWWGAWLNQNPQKIIIAPKQWVKSRYNPKDIVPENWIKI